MAADFSVTLGQSSLQQETRDSMEVDWRRINVEYAQEKRRWIQVLICRSQFDEDKLAAEDLFEPVQTQDSSHIQQEVRQSISRYCSISL